MHENLWIEDFSSSKTWIRGEAGVKLLILLQRVFVPNFAGGGIWVLPKQVEKTHILWRWKTGFPSFKKSIEYLPALTGFLATPQSGTDHSSSLLAPTQFFSHGDLLWDWQQAFSITNWPYRCRKLCFHSVKFTWANTLRWATWNHVNCVISKPFYNIVLWLEHKASLEWLFIAPYITR